MNGEFSENSSCLLKDSLTMETPAFLGQIAVPERHDSGVAARFNLLFTMRACHGGAARHRVRGP
jgi:hypothetical protein